MYKLPLLLAAARNMAGAGSVGTKNNLVRPDTPFDERKGVDMSTLMVPHLLPLGGLALSLIMIIAFHVDFSALAGVGADFDPGSLWPPIPRLIGP